MKREEQARLGEYVRIQFIKKTLALEAAGSETYLVNQLVRGSAPREDSGILQNTQPTLDIWFGSSEFVFLWLCIVEAFSIM